MRNGMQTPRSKSSCSMALLDLPDCKALLSVSLVAVWLLLAMVPLTETSALDAAAKFKTRIADDFLFLLSTVAWKQIVVCDGAYLRLVEQGTVFA